MSTLQEQEMNVENNSTSSNEAFVEDIVNEQAISNDQVAETQQNAPEQVSQIDYEAESKKFQSMYDRAQADNAKLQQGGQILQLLESRPDLVQMLEDGIANPQTQNNETIPVDDFNPWDAFQSDDSVSGKFVNKKIENKVDQIVSERLAQQQQQMQAEMQMNNTVNELRGTYKMSDNDIQDFLSFTTKPKEKVGLNSLVKLWQMENGQHFANNDTVEAVSAAKQAPRTAGVLQGQAPQSPKSDQDKVWDTIMGSGSGGALP